MSRLDPSRELRDFLDVIEDRAEVAQDSGRGLPEHRQIENQTSDARAPEKPSAERELPEMHSGSTRGVLYDRDHGYRVSPSEIRSIADLGRFRVIAENDLGKYLYGGQSKALENNLGNLVRQGLVRRGSFQGPEDSPRDLLTLTKRGHRLLRANQLVPPDQATYFGFVKPREANHDADLYRLYQKEAGQIEQQGGRVRRIVLDFEIKRKINRDLAKFGTQARPEIAARHGLQVVRNKIPIPDLQIEYETRDGDLDRVNLELVTEHYRGRNIAEKARAGFSLYTPRGEGDRLRRILDQQELTAEILSL
jgi:DNA-binding MarR family transcriptional regulator